MNFQVQVSKERLDKTLGILKHALERRVTLPILQHVLLEVQDHEMTLKATDMELAFEAVLPVEGRGNRTVAIPGKKFVETVRVYPEGLLTLEWPDTGNRIWLRAKGFNSEHNIQPGEGFPELPKPEAGLPSVVVPSALFRKAINLGSISVSKDATKPALSGVLLHMGRSFIRVVSTDGFRLAVVEVPMETGLEADARIIVPRRALDLLPSSLGDDGQLTLSWDERSLFMDQPGLKFSTRRVTGNYPAYEKVLPSELPRKVIVDREDFLKTLRVVGLKKDDYNKNVRLFFEFPNLRVFFQHPDEGVNQGTISFTGEENPLELAFNIDYLTELLERIPGEEVVYQFKDDVGQGIFMSPSIEDMSFRYILMPVKFANPS
ncbi:DNA polymerase III subunit beta [Mesoterricola silvestris]|uniref:Beta sliding clamp n=1 Tax=Mesoterricola silvestris TaxID=2927979 RepID=A0AA48GV05_9BACT|nr:DNA polymerase III subunit beta [Mesoterricola silvestris]BDU70828.1 DNA polymerase III subunit beta [Mesoterricola silvestris]